MSTATFVVSVSLLATVYSSAGLVFWTWLNSQAAMVSEQFQSSYRAVLQRFQKKILRAVSEQFYNGFRVVLEQFQSSFTTVSEQFLRAVSEQF